MSEHWMRLPADGTFALAADDATRDRLTPFGWRVATEPGDLDFVWMHHEGIERPARFPYASRAYWLAQGWTPGLAPERVDLTKDPARIAADPAPKTKAGGKQAAPVKEN